MHRGVNAIFTFSIPMDTSCRLLAHYEEFAKRLCSQEICNGGWNELTIYELLSITGAFTQAIPNWHSSLPLLDRRLHQREEPRY